MKACEKAMLALLARAMFGANPSLEGQIDMEGLYAEAKVQTVLPLVYNALDEAERALLASFTKEKFKQTFGHFLLTNEQVLYEQSQVLAAFQRAELPCVILKGVGVACNYPDPSLRVLGDIDLLVDLTELERARTLLREQGYEEKEEGDLHLAFQKDGVTVELHKKPISLSFNENAEIEKAVEGYFADIIEARQWTGETPIPADKHLAMVLLMHKLEHFLNGELGLRQLCDWATFVRAKMTPALWDELVPRLEAFGLRTFALVMTRACIDYLGLPKASAPWATDCDEELAREVIELILECGNFGGKLENSYGQRLFVDAHSKNRVSSFFKVLFSSCKTHWAPCAKHPILMPVAPFVVYCKYLKMRRQGKRKKLKLRDVYQKAGTRQKLYRELKPFIPEVQNEK